MSVFPVLSESELRVRKIMGDRRLSFAARGALAWMIYGGKAHVSVLELSDLGGVSEQAARLIVLELLAEGYLALPTSFDGIELGRTER